MKIVEKIKNKAENNYNGNAVTVAFLGDSVTQGCFEVYKNGESSMETIYDQQHAYHRYFKDMLTLIYPSVPINIVNAGISGSHAPHGLEKIEDDVLKHSPDLTVVCFGLNDSTKGLENIDEYTHALIKIFEKLKKIDSEIIFMTPNMMCTEISWHISEPFLREVAENTVKIQNEGILDKYMDAARKVCIENGVKVCDCYKKWKRMHECGVNITDLLANNINHPTREMNKLFAISLIEAIFEDE